MKNTQLILKLSYILGFTASSFSHAGIPLWSFTPSLNFPPVQTVNFNATSTIQYLITSNTSKAHQLVIEPIKGISQIGKCILPPKSTCLLTLAVNGAEIDENVVGGPILCQTFADGSPNANLCYLPSPGNTIKLTKSHNVALTSSTSFLGLSVNNTTINPALTGNPRIFTVTNSGTVTARNFAVSFPNWPTGTTATSTCGSNLAPGASCSVTVIPGPSATLDSASNPCSTGTQPLPNEVKFTADNADTKIVDVAVLSYGCIYQDGYIFAVDDTTPNTSSIGGKIASTVDQATTSNGVFWASNGSGPNAISYDLIPYTQQTNDGPTYAQALTQFNITYNSSMHPFPPPSAFRICNALIDGACTTSNIVALYNTYNTNYGIGSPPYTPSDGPTNLSFYASGRCKQPIGAYSDWYLPAICEMGYFQSICGGSSVTPLTQNMQSNLQDTLSLFPAGFYYSSTIQETVTIPFNVWVSNFGTNDQGVLGANNPFAVRCVRGLTNTA